MKKLILVISFSLALSFVYCGPNSGYTVGCATQATQTCEGCVPSNQSSSIWDYDTNNNCYLKDCSAQINSQLLNVNACQSCMYISTTSFGQGKYYNPALNSCTNDCTSIPKATNVNDVCKCIDPYAEILSSTQNTCVCKAGTYGTASSSMSSGCSTCPSPGTGVSIPSTAGDITSCCDADYYGTTSCTKCPTGTEADVNTAAQITDCKPKDKNAILDGSGNFICKAGYYGTASLTSISGCFSCPSPGTGVNASPIAGNTKSCCDADYYGTATCSKCPTGSTATINSATVVTDCKPKDNNAVVDSSGNLVCKAGYYGSASQTNQTGCFSCPSPGTGVNAPASTGNNKSCCDADYYGTATCNKCPTGSTAAVNSAAAVTDCVPNDNHAVVDGSGNLVCKAGYYGSASQTSQTGCFSCPSPGTGVNAPASAGNNKSCCDADYYGTATCNKCPTGSTAAVNSAAAVTDCVPNDNHAVVDAQGNIVCKTGFYGIASQTSTSGCTKCPDAGDGVSIPLSSGNIKSCCTVDYYGTTNCTKCPTGKTAKVNSAATEIDCVDSSTQAQTTFAFMLDFAFIFGMISLLF